MSSSTQITPRLVAAAAVPPDSALAPQRPDRNRGAAIFFANFPRFSDNAPLAAK
jgi:hypothetical protein